MKDIQHLDKHTARMLGHLHRLATENGGHIRFGEFGGAYMPLCVEIIGPNAISIAHYGKQNGDLMADPEVVFICCDEACAFFPYSITQHYMASYVEVLEMPAHPDNPIDPTNVKIRQAAYAGLVKFVRGWFKNLLSQHPEAFKTMEGEGDAQSLLEVTC